MQGLSDIYVTLRALLESGGVTRIKEFNVLVLGLNKAPSVSNISIIDSIVSWDLVIGATSYLIYVNGVNQATLYSNTFDLSTIIITSGNYTIGIQTIKFSDYTHDSNITTINYQVSTDSGYSGSYYDLINPDLVGDALKLELRSLTTSTQTKNTTYEHLKTDLQYTDADLDTEGNIILFYSRISIPSTWDGGTSWNREHVWPQSLGWFTTSAAGSDLHHLRPADPSVNSSRGNLKFGEVTNGTVVKLSAANGGADTDCYRNGTYFEPTDEVKGDIARIIFYLFTRYTESDSYSFTDVAKSLEMLLSWHLQDPVDRVEMIRNDRIQELQGNRNPYIDNSNYASLIWG